MNFVNVPLISVFLIMMILMIIIISSNRVSKNFLTLRTNGQKSSLEGVMKRRMRMSTAGVASPTIPSLHPA